jgi:glyoxylase-like metal-dependent hydrolase (beta-lactamase superfamily II)
MPEPLHIQMFTLGMWQTNCYLAAAGDRCWVIDVGFEPEPMLTYIRDNRLALEKVVLTHAHLDHIAGLAELQQQFPDVPVYLHEAERRFPGDPNLNLSGPFGLPMTAPDATDLLKGDETLDLAGHRFELRHTPGHSPGNICLYQADAGVALVGDTLFAGSVGRHDFPTSDPQALIQSIQQQLYTLPDHTRVLPGHGPETTIGQEKATNPYVRV